VSASHGMPSNLDKRVRRALRERNKARADADARYAEVLRELLSEGYSLADIAAVLGVSRQRVHQLVR